MNEPILPTQPFIPRRPSRCLKKPLGAAGAAASRAGADAADAALAPGTGIVPDGIPSRQYIFQMYDDRTLENIIRLSIMERLNKRRTGSANGRSRT